VSTRVPLPLLSTTAMQTHTVIGPVLLCLLAGRVDAQRRQATPAQLIERKLQKLDAPFLKNGDWTTSFADAKKRAKEEGKLIFGYFTRSYSP
jgi:hypothetical protein